MPEALALVLVLFQPLLALGRRFHSASTLTMSSWEVPATKALDCVGVLVRDGVVDRLRRRENAALFDEVFDLLLLFAKEPVDHRVETARPAVLLFVLHGEVIHVLIGALIRLLLDLSFRPSRSFFSSHVPSASISFLLQPRSKALCWRLANASRRSRKSTLRSRSTSRRALSHCAE